MSSYIGEQTVSQHKQKLQEMEQNYDPNNSQQTALLEEMRAQVKKLEELTKNEDPRLSFTTPEFKEAQRIFSENLKKNFGRPIEYATVKDFPWSTPSLRKLQTPVDVNGNPIKQT
eukprot:TRINITY_DN7550_c0_g1_i4.p2 TRINITY_DN7550_c0_g1~~TRINITY_DN7550_c0_g1_i4.p2  ORF type:complete len:115 (-),score=21.31 TRINITY_DN7550_c0_g1_i4:371-715(-)